MKQMNFIKNSSGVKNSILTLINILEVQITGEITRLEQIELPDWESEQTKLSVYQQLTQTILENYEL